MGAVLTDFSEKWLRQPGSGSRCQVANPPVKGLTTLLRGGRSMRKLFYLVMVSCVIALCFSTNAWSLGRKTTIKVGINAPMTGDIPKVGEGSKYAAEMWLEDITKAGGIEVGGKKYPVELVVEDNESKAESAVKANTKMITQDDVLVIIGPQSSKQAIPAGDVANNYETPMISPWSTNPATTADRPYVFRGCFLDPFQGPSSG